jgi:hypothetical protein
MERADHRDFTGLAGRTRPGARRTNPKAAGIAETLRERREREGTKKHAGPAGLRGSAGSMMKAYGGRSTRTGRGRMLRT